MIQTISRYAVSFVVAGMVVFSLFYLMQYLIVSADRTLDEEAAGRLLDFVRVPEPEVIKPKEPPKKPPPPDQPPDEPPPPQLSDVNPEAESIPVTAVDIAAGIDMDSGGFGLANDGEYLPIVKVSPIYPNNALSRGIEGYVIVEFTVTRLGTVENVTVVESQPSGIFDRAAMQAAAKFKYKPRVIDGTPIEVPGVQNKITFEIEN